MTNADFAGMVKQVAGLGKPVGIKIERYSGTAVSRYGQQNFSEYKMLISIERNGRIEDHTAFSGKRDRMEKLAAQTAKMLNL